MSFLLLIRGVICAVDCFSLFFYSDPLDNLIFPEQIKSDSCRFFPLQEITLLKRATSKGSETTDNWKASSLTTGRKVRIERHNSQPMYFYVNS